MKFFIAFVLFYVSLLAQEEVNIKVEHGLIHSKQEGRYKIVQTLPEKADGFDQSFDYAKPFATFRLANIVTEQAKVGAMDETKTLGTAFGGIFGFDTASLYGLHLHLGAYISQKIHALNPDSGSSFEQNGAFFDIDKGSYAYIGEASIDYASERVDAKAGRIRIETPFADSDDIRMSPNSFEGVWTNITLTDDLQMQAYFLTRWAGTDSADDISGQDEFKPLTTDGYGLSGASMTYNFDQLNALSIWYYNVDTRADLIYVEGAGELYFSEAFHMEWGLQGGHGLERDNSSVEGDVLGGMLIADYSALYLGIAYNYVFVEEGKFITDGFGGGPYYTSLDEMTIGAVSELAPGNDIQVFRLALGVDFSELSSEEINIELIHGHFMLESSNAEVIESDIVFWYGITDRWSLESIYAYVDQKNISTTEPDNRDFQRLVTRLDYSF